VIKSRVGARHSRTRLAPKTCKLPGHHVDRGQGLWYEDFWYRKLICSW